MQNNLIENRHVRVFISSTFQDLQDERDYLMKRTFPELRRIAAERNVTLTELDLRWGITEEEADNGKVVEICLREIENSIPFFIGIIGNRYGWCPSTNDISNSAIERYEQIEDYLNRHLSITEMEMQFGVLERSEHMNASFYISDKELDLYSIDYPQKLVALKETILNNKRYPVYMFSSKEDLAKHIKNSFLKLLDELFPLERNLSFLEKFQIEQKSFKNQLCQTYIPEESNFIILDRWLEDNTSNTLVINGDSGLGKSALIANWLDRKLQCKYNDYEFIYIFIGTGGSECNAEIIKTIIALEIKERLGIAQSVFNADNAIDINELFIRFSATNKKTILILDGINQLSNNNGKNLDWLPYPPPNAKILISTLNDDPTMEILNARHYKVHTLKPLDKPRKSRVIETYLGKFAKRLSKYQIEKIINRPICSNTLVLRTLLDELINFGLYEKIDDRIDYYISTDSIEDFYKLLLSNYEHEFGTDFIKNILATIAISRNGLTETELLAINKVSTINWSQFYCSFLRHFNLSNGLISFSHQYLRNAVNEKYLSKSDIQHYRTLVYDWFKRNPCDRSLLEIPYQLYESGKKDKLYDFLSDYNTFSFLFSFDYDFLRIYWNYLIQSNSEKYTLDVYRYGDCRDLNNEYYANVLNQVGYFVEHNYSKYELSLYCYDKSLKIRIKHLGKNNVDTAISYNNLGTVHMELGNYTEAINMYHSALTIRQKLFGEISSEVATTYNNIGTVYKNVDCTKAIPYLQKALDIRKELYGEHSTDVATSYNNIASIYLTLHTTKSLVEEQLILTKQYLESAINIQQGLVGTYDENLATFFSNLSLAYTYLKDYNNAIIYCQKSLDINLALFINGHHSITHNYINMGGIYSMMSNYKQSILYYEKALIARIEIYGKDDIRVADVYVLMGNDYSIIGDTTKALECFLKAIDIYNQSQYNNIVNTSAISDIYNGIGFSYYLLGENDKAIYYYSKALTIQEELRVCNSEDSSFVAILINNIARAYFNKGDMDMAYTQQAKALDMQLKILGENSIDVARSYNNIGLIYMKKNNYEKALNYLLKGKNIRLNLAGDNRLDIADSTINLGDLYYKHSKNNDALECYITAYNIYVDIFGKQNRKCQDLVERILKIKEHNII